MTGTWHRYTPVVCQSIKHVHGAAYIYTSRRTLLRHHRPTVIGDAAEKKANGAIGERGNGASYVADVICECVDLQRLGGP